MYDRFGPPGLLAAYNAGLARYEEYLASGRALPHETSNCLAILAPHIRTGTDVAQATSPPNRTQDWRDAPLFAATAEDAQDRVDDCLLVESDGSRDGIFVPLSQEQWPRSAKSHDLVLWQAQSQNSASAGRSTRSHRKAGKIKAARCAAMNLLYSRRLSHFAREHRKVRLPTSHWSC